MIHKLQIILSILLLSNSCISEFIPQTNEDKEIIVVEGLITDNPGPNTIKLTKSLPLGTRSAAIPLKGYSVSISDDLDNTFNFNETVAGTYVSDSAKFRGVTGRFYTLHINNNSTSTSANLRYESYPMKMKPVPEIDSIYYDKVALSRFPNGLLSGEGCQIYLNTHDPTNQCKFYRWEYTETWEFHLPYSVQNNICWTSGNSEIINIKNTSVLEENRINNYPLTFISNLTDRLRVRYSILVKQYSLNEDEYLYWEKLQNITEQVGGLYDIIPSSVPSNVYCLDDPNERVLGYFSVSATSSKRIFINDRFAGVKTPYTDDVCIADTIFGTAVLPSLNVSVWVIEISSRPPYTVITYTRGCVDCTTRGTKIKPLFWKEGK